MRVSIWDLDYYYAKNKKNKLNTDIMRISSYHKQKGDQVNFVLKDDDINRPFDLYYIVKENSKTPNPPGRFFLEHNIRWWGKAFKPRINWKMPDIMLAVRPDYLLYPNKNTDAEKSEYIRLFNNQAKILPRTQDCSNTFEGVKHAVVTDTKMWYASKKDLIIALKRLADIEKLSFSEPIWIQKIISDEDIKKLFLELKPSPGAKFTWVPIPIEDFDTHIKFLQEINEKWSRILIGPLQVILTPRHWGSPETAQKDFQRVKEIILKGKELGLQVQLAPFKQRMDTPYFFIFEQISQWTMSKKNTLSWLEYITWEYKMEGEWNFPAHWNRVFRDLLRQTYQDHDFLLIRRKDNRISENDIPWLLWDKEFEYGL